MSLRDSVTKRDSQRLPKGVKPKHYSILFDFDPKRHAYSGREEILLDISKNISRIFLNSRDLDIRRASLEFGGKTLDAAVTIDNEKERLQVRLPRPVKGKAKLILEFGGKLRDDLVGLYKSTYRAKDGSERMMVTTQFEAAHARKAFPCFDEPDLKATFEVSVRIDKYLEAISNMPTEKTITEGERKLIRFQTSPRTSTYLLYLGIGRFEFLEGIQDKTLIRVVTTEGKKQQGEYALDLTKKFLAYFTEYSGIPYPLPKLDMIAIPDFAMGAMENWGAITFREVYLLSDQSTSELMKEQIALIIAHEMWHMWSGDLVTMAWWNDLWLNESFANYMEYKAVDRYFPQWNVWEKFVNNETDSAFADDALRTTHPIEVEIRNPTEIEEVFDAISYSKGGSVLRMLDEYLGHEKFRKGVNAYLSKHSYGNATASDLWSSLSRFSGAPVKEIMSRWIRTKGYPLIEAESDGKLLSLKQRRFMFRTKNDRATWPIPIVLKRSGRPEATELMDARSSTVSLGKAPLWFKLNYNQSGFYRVKYSAEDLDKLRKAIERKELPALDRWGVQNDLYRLTMNGDASIDAYLGLLSAYDDEDNYMVLSSISANLYQIYFNFSQERSWRDIWPVFRTRFRAPFKKALKRLGWTPIKGESENDNMLRDRAIRNLVFTEDEETLREAKERYRRYLADQSSLHPDIKRAVLFAAAYTGDERTYREMIDLYRKSKGIEEKIILLNSLGQFRNAGIERNALEFFLTGEVRLQELAIAVGSASNNPYARDLLLPWLDKNWKKIKKYESGVSIFTRILESVISAQAGEEKEKELKRFFSSHPTQYRMAMERAFERMRRNTAWVESNRKTLVDYFIGDKLR